MRISDWSSDVCSSDLLMQISTHPLNLSFAPDVALPFGYKAFAWEGSECYPDLLGAIDRARSEGRDLVINVPSVPLLGWRSEERREGTECVRTCRSLGSPEHKKKNNTPTYDKKQ